MEQIIQNLQEEMSRITDAQFQTTSSLSSLTARVDRSITQLESTLGEIQRSTQGLSPDRLAEVQRLLSTVEAIDLTTISGEITTMKSDMVILRDSTIGCSTRIDTVQQMIQARGHSEVSRPQKIMIEYKCWDDVKRLDNDRSSFRDWKMKFQNAYKQSTKVSGYKVIFEEFEKWEVLRDRTLTETTIKRIFEGLCDGISGVVRDDFDKTNAELESILQMKVEDKSQASILLRRAIAEGGSGLLAWIWINGYYLSTSGLGMSKTRSR